MNAVVGMGLPMPDEERQRVRKEGTELDRLYRGGSSCKTPLVSKAKSSGMDVLLFPGRPLYGLSSRQLQALSSFSLGKLRRDY